MQNPSQPIVLASASPRRTELLKVLGISHVIHPADIDEQPLASEAPADYVLRMAREKAAVVSRQYPQRVVLAADTIVVLNRQLLGKPADGLEAVRFLRRLSGNTHHVTTAVAISGGSRAERRTCHSVQTSLVTFLPLSDQQISRYVATGEPLGKAGAYAIQGRGAAFIRHLNGSYSGVMGLPLAETMGLLQQFIET